MVKILYNLPEHAAEYLRRIKGILDRADGNMMDTLLYSETVELLKPHFSEHGIVCDGEESCGLPGSKIYKLRLVR